MRGRNPSADSGPRPGAGGLLPSARMKEYPGLAQSAKSQGFGGSAPKLFVNRPPP